MTKKLKKATENLSNQKPERYYKIIIKCCTTGIVTLVVSITKVGGKVLSYMHGQARTV